MDADVIVVGGGVGGLACARELTRGGRSVIVLEKARGVGGRCATRRYEEQPVDFGALFLHGRQPAFLAALDEVEGVTPVPGWPLRVSGRGAPCQPDAFDPAERRVAWVEGVTAFAKHLARGLDVRLQARVERLEAAEGSFTVGLLDGGSIRAPGVVLATPLEQAAALLEDLPESAEVGGIRSLLGMFGSLPCLSLVAGYGMETPEPDFDVMYPEDSPCLLLVGNESAKRPGAAARTLVLQALPRWSREHLEQAPEQWAPVLLADAAERIGPWVREPRWTDAHRWRYARLDRGTELSSPVRMPVDGAGIIGICGELFAAGGGLQAAYLSGTRLAQRWLEEAS